MSSSNLTRDEARDRAALISDVSYEVSIDLTSEDARGVETVIHFAASRPGATTFLDCADAEVAEATLNGRPVDTHDGVRMRLDGLEPRNEVRVRSTGEYSRSGSGLMRFRDPVDGAVYVHSDCEPMHAHQIYPCFDQPDLKARFRFSLLTPEGWEAASNMPPTGAPEREGSGSRWRFEETPLIPTYIAAVVAGDYHVVRDRHRDTDLGVYCRRSLAPHVEAEEWVEITKQGLDFFEQAFATPYVFGKYDQVVVPEFGAGAMENPGLVTFNERYIFRSNVTATERELRAGTILHEMAHMWFGDLVTMRWWNGTWLNEAFATFMEMLATDAYRPEWERWTAFGPARTAAFDTDALGT
ncbi:MAG: M1 family metallopeptidase, partial [Actinomycetota bacterium]